MASVCSWKGGRKRSCQGSLDAKSTEDRKVSIPGTMHRKYLFRSLASSLLLAPDQLMNVFITLPRTLGTVPRAET